MIIPDINFLIYAYNSESKFHSQASHCLEELFASNTTILLPWLVILGFLRISTSRKIFASPYTNQEAWEIVDSWFEKGNASVIEPGTRFYGIMKGLCKDNNVVSDLLNDVYLASLAIENQCDLYSNDFDFARFKGVKWINPFAQ